MKKNINVIDNKETYDEDMMKYQDDLMFSMMQEKILCKIMSLNNTFDNYELLLNIDILISGGEE